MDEIEEIKERLSRLEEAVWGMDYDTARRVLDSYIEAANEHRYIEASKHVKTAERMLGV